MGKFLIEYKGVPAILNHSMEDVGKVIYIVVYKIDEFAFQRKNFDTIEGAFEFESGNANKLLFISLESSIAENGHNHSRYASLEFVDGCLSVTGQITKTYSNYKIKLTFGSDVFAIEKSEIGSDETVANFLFTRRIKKEVNNKTQFEFFDSYYEIIPRYEDIFLESIFILDVIKNNIEINDQGRLEAYMLQAKIKAGKNFISKKAVESSNQESKVPSAEVITLENLVGLDKIKLEIRELESLAEFRKIRLHAGIPVTPATLHLVFTGNPGTGKSTIARLLAKVYFDKGLLSENKVIEVTRKDFPADDIGQTSSGVQKIYEAAIGGILFIDDASSLFKSGNKLGTEALSALLNLIDNNKEKVVVIIAGLPKDIDELLATSAGLKSKFSKRLHFEDYTTQELFKIFNGMVLNYCNVLSEETKYKMEHLIETYFDSGYFNSNAKAIRNIFDEMIEQQSLRMSKTGIQLKKI